MAKRIIETTVQEEDIKIEGSLRPQFLCDYEVSLMVQW